MNELAEALGLAFLAEPWVLKLLGIFAGVLAVNLAMRFFLHQAKRVAGKTRTVWDDALLRAAGSPARVAVWIAGIALALDLVSRNFALNWGFVDAARNTGLVLAMAWFLIRLIQHVTANVLAARIDADEEADPTTLDALSKLARLTVIVLAVLFAMQTLGVKITGLLAAGGIGGIAIGFAAKDLLANFFGGLTIYMDRPFSVGEWIRSPDKDIEGTVEHISWRHTRIRRFNKNPIYVPNALFTTIAVENPSRMSNRRIKETIGIRYSDIDKMAAIVAEVKSMLLSHPDIDTSQTLIVNFNAFAASSLDFLIYTFTKTREWERYHEVKQDVLLRIAGIISAHGAEIAFPTRTLHIERDEMAVV